QLARVSVSARGPRLSHRPAGLPRHREPDTHIRAGSGEAGLAGAGDPRRRAGDGPGRHGRVVALRPPRPPVPAAPPARPLRYLSFPNPKSETRNPKRRGTGPYALVPRRSLGTSCLGGSASFLRARHASRTARFPGRAWERENGRVSPAL